MSSTCLSLSAWWNVEPCGETAAVQTTQQRADTPSRNTHTEFTVRWGGGGRGWGVVSVKGGGWSRHRCVLNRTYLRPIIWFCSDHLAPDGTGFPAVMARLSLAEVDLLLLLVLALVSNPPEWLPAWHTRACCKPWGNLLFDERDLFFTWTKWHFIKSNYWSWQNMLK